MIIKSVKSGYRVTSEYNGQSENVGYIEVHQGEWVLCTLGNYDMSPTFSAKNLRDLLMFMDMLTLKS